MYVYENIQSHIYICICKNIDIHTHTKHTTLIRHPNVQTGGLRGARVLAVPALGNRHAPRPGSSIQLP